ncbi:MAG: iron chaperone [Candidatus Dojkabacteria bacterium]
MNAEDNKTGTFSDFEKEAMRNRAKELKEEAKASKNREVGEKMIIDAISTMIPSDKAMAQKIHEIVSKAAPQLMPKTWYGMPAYADKDGKAVVFFQPADKFKARYSTLGFNDSAKLDEGNMWPAAYALTKLTPEEEKKIIELVKKAVS